MAMVCPQCSGSFGQELHCPTCGVRLLYESLPLKREQVLVGSAGLGLHTPLGRLVAGVLMAQGLAYGLQLSCNAVMQVAAEDAEQSGWSTLYGLVLLQVIQGISLLAGGALAGAGQKRATVVGAVVGLVHGFLVLLWQHLEGETLTEVTLYGQPMLYIALGTLGAVVGSCIWRPLPTLAMPEFGTDKQAKPAHKGLTLLEALRGPVAWGRVSAGIVIVTAGFLWGPNLLALVLHASQGSLQVNDRLQAQLVTWEIIGLATLVGAAVAGATTRNGLKQGLCVGAGASILLFGNFLGGKGGFLDQIFYTLFSIISLTLAGGWFGGQLFPPILVHSRRKVSWDR